MRDAALDAARATSIEARLRARDARSPRRMAATMAEALPQSFEAKLARLEAIVKELEGGIDRLERAIELFQRRQNVGGECEALLKGCAGANRSRQSRRTAAGIAAVGDSAVDEPTVRLDEAVAARPG